MRHRNINQRFGRDTSHRKALFSNMAMALLRHEKIETTVPKAKELRRKIDRLITLGKQDTLHARRLVYRIIKDRDLIKKLFSDLAVRFKDRPGGYTRIVRTGIRAGDAAPLGIIELVGPLTERKQRKHREEVADKPTNVVSKEQAFQAQPAETVPTETVPAETSEQPAGEKTETPAG